MQHCFVSILVPVTWQDNKQMETLGFGNLISRDYNFRLSSSKTVVPITVCLWDPAVLACSATAEVVIGGRRLLRLSGSGEGEVSCSCAVGLKCTSKNRKHTQFICLVLCKRTILSVYLALCRQTVKTKSNGGSILLQDAGVRVDYQRRFKSSAAGEVWQKSFIY